MNHIAKCLLFLPVVAVAAVAVWFWQAGKGYDAWPCNFGEHEA